MVHAAFWPRGSFRGYGDDSRPCPIPCSHTRNRDCQEPIGGRSLYHPLSAAMPSGSRGGNRNEFDHVGSGLPAALPVWFRLDRQVHLCEDQCREHREPIVAWPRCRPFVDAGELDTGSTAGETPTSFRDKSVGCCFRIRNSSKVREGICF